MGMTVKCDGDAHSVRLVPPEFMIWQKAYVMERERFDGADVAHMLRSCALEMDWPRLVDLFGPDWLLLLSHLVLFGFIYPSERALIPQAILAELLGRLEQEEVMESEDADQRLCQGTLLSRAQYLPDVERWGFADARMSERCHMSDSDLRLWTDAIDAGG